MSDPSLETVQLREYVQRWQAGDSKAADELLRRIGERVERLVRRMLRGYPNVRSWADTGDIFQGAVCRLLNTLRKLAPANTRDFFNLAAVHIRRELLDLARKYAGKQELRARGQDESDEDEQPVAEQVEPEELEMWTRLHETVEQLPAEDREVFSLVFYHGWTQPQIAELFTVNERTIRRRWQSACLELSRRLGGQLPAP